MKKDFEQPKDTFYSVDDRQKYRPIIKYDRKVPQFFDFGKLSKHENSATYAILGELRDRFNPEGVVFSYKDIAYMSGHVQEYPDGSIYARTGKRFDKFIEKLQIKLQGVAYREYIGIREGKEVYEVYPLFNRFTVNHADQELTVYLSDEQIHKEVIDEQGNIVQSELRVKDLFNNADWSTTQYLKFSRQLHNNLSVPAQNLYRFLSEYRSWGRASMNAEVFENKVMHFVTTNDKRNKSSILKKAVKELSDLTYDGQHPIFPNLEYSVERRRSKNAKYHFTFKPFSVDLNHIDKVEGGNVVFNTSDKVVIKEVDLIDQEVLSKFHEVFSTQPNHDNGHNRKQINHYINSVSKEAVLEALDRTSMDGRRGIGWFLKLLKNWEREGVNSLEDIEKAEGKLFNKSLKKEIVEINNIPRWFKENSSNQNTKKDPKELSDRTNEILKEMQNLIFLRMKCVDDEENLKYIQERHMELQDELNQLMKNGTYYQR